MTDILRSDYHDLFYTKVLGYYRKLVNESGALHNRWTLLEQSSNLNIGYVFQPRGDEQTARNYQRDRWIENRHKYVCMRRGDMPRYAVVTSYDPKEDKITIYSNSLKLIFNDDTALEELKELLDKFYTVEVEERFPNGYVDTGSGRRDELTEVMR